MDASTIGTPHRRRLRQIWRSAGWPCQDDVEVDLLAAGLVERQRDIVGRETLRVTDAGVHALAQTLARNRGAFGAHEALVRRVALDMARAGRVVWTRLSLRTRVDDAWVVAMPDVFSIRHTSVEAYVEPVVHEVKVSRADLLADLRRGPKGAAYCAVSSQCWYVLRDGIADASELPEAYGVMVAREQALEVLRPAPRRAAALPFAVWMALARATPQAIDDDAQGHLGDPGGDSAQSPG
jgi:hypothetical protein